MGVFLEEVDSFFCVGLGFGLGVGGGEDYRALRGVGGRVVGLDLSYRGFY